MRVHIATLGCRLNQSESDRIARELTALGHEVVAEARLAELQVVNTCAVTHKATRESRQVVRAGQRAAPELVTVVTGCAGEIEPEYFEAAARPDGPALLVTAHAEKERLVPLLIERGILPAPDAELNEAFPVAQGRTRAFVKIQDGCGNHCAYCVSRLARGAERSRSISAVVHEINTLHRAGYQEVVLTGLHAASYGRDLGTSLVELLRAILAQTSVPRLRLSSLEPWGASDALLDLWSDARLCRHLHLPLQAGSDVTLRRMRRGYNTRQFAARVEAARRRVSGIGISTDLIAGFPGESDEEFEASLRFVEQMQFSQAHVFPFSARAGTEAAGMGAQVPQAVKQARSRTLRRSVECEHTRFREALCGQRLQVLWEACQHGEWSGLSDNFVRVFCTSAQPLHNRITSTRIMALHPEGVAGMLLSGA